MTVVQFPHYNLHSIPEALRKLAKDIEDGKRSSTNAIVATYAPGMGVTYSVFGEDIDGVTAAGILSATISQIIEDTSNDNR